MVICVIGLHHVPKEKLDLFIQSIRRVLKPNGVFILRDHNATTADLTSLISVAHTVFNLIMNHDSLKTELHNIEIFKALNIGSIY